MRTVRQSCRPVQPSGNSGCATTVWRRLLYTILSMGDTEVVPSSLDEIADGEPRRHHD